MKEQNKKRLRLDKKTIQQLSKLQSKNLAGGAAADTLAAKTKQCPSAVALTCNPDTSVNEP